MLDVIMLCYQFTPKTMRAIDSLLSNSEDINLIIVSKKQSVAKNRNEWLKRKISDPYVMCDDDIVVQGGWLEALREAMADGVGVAGTKMTDIRGTLWSIPQNQSEGEVHQLNGGCCMYKNIGILADERFVGSQWEDTDIQWEYKKRGYKIVSTHKAVVAHEGGMTNANSINEKLFEDKWST